MDEQNFEISFEGCDAAEAAQLANGLEQELRESGKAQVSLKKARADSQDFGATLVLVFGTPVAIALAKGIAVFLQRHSGASIKITKAGEVIATNLDSRDASRIAEAFAAKKR
jgi:hypothetical protein